MTTKLTTCSIPNGNKWDFDCLCEWLNNNANVQRRWYFTDDGCIIFEDESDATIYTLKWL